MFQPIKVFEYLCYLVVFILLFKLSEANPFNGNMAAAPASKSGESDFDRRRSDEAIVEKRSFTECDAGFSWMCLKVEFVKLMERLAEQEEFNVLPGISVVKDMNATDVKSTEMMAEVARNFPNDPNTRLNGYIMTKLTNFLQNHYLRFKLIDPNTVAEARSAVATGRKGKFGKKGGYEALVAAGLMMKGTLMAVGMGAIALLAGKALMTALMALMLSGILGLKSLASGHGKSTTYEIVAKPVYTSSHSHSIGSGGVDAHYSAGTGHSTSAGYGGY